MYDNPPPDPNALYAYYSYSQFRSVFGIASIPNTDFGSLKPNKLSNYSPWL